MDLYHWILKNFFLVLPVVILVDVLFLMTASNLLKEISPVNRFISPDDAWLLLIPVFNFVWRFIVVSRIADSIQKELLSAPSAYLKANQNKFKVEDKPGYQVGIAYCVFDLCSFIPFLGTLFFVARIICWIVYWTKLSTYKTRFQYASKLSDN